MICAYLEGSSLERIVRKNFLFKLDIQIHDKALTIVICGATPKRKFVLEYASTTQD